MKKNQRGYSTVEVVVAVAVVGILGIAGWFVYGNRSDSGKDSTAKQPAGQNDKKDSKPDPRESSYETAEGIKYTVISDWKDAKTPYASDGSIQSNYLLSPDYKEGGGGQLNIVSGAYIHFHEAGWAGISPDTSLEQAVDIIKKGESYYDPASARIESFGGKQAVTFNSGHTTDGVTVMYKTSSDKWLEANFSTQAGGSGYTAQKSPHYETFLSWLNKFLELN